MDKAHYIIFHPDSARQEVFVKAMALVKGSIVPSWTGNIYVDQIGIGNEDPFVFNDPWLYSYCHASQLRRNVRNDSYLQIGSKLIFVSGQDANNGLLTIDTVFLIGGVQKWSSNPLQLPISYQDHFQNNNSQLWERHFRYPFGGSHESVSHTYEAEIWKKDKVEYSFLPLDMSGQRVSIPFTILPLKLRNKILGNVRGKYPVLLDNTEINLIAAKVDSYAHIKVVKIKSVRTSIISKWSNCGRKSMYNCCK